MKASLNVQGVLEKMLVSVQRPTTQDWKQLIGKVGAVFKSSGYQLLSQRSSGLCKSISEKIASESGYPKTKNC